MERKRILNITLWIVALLIVNVIWSNVARSEASQQLNDRGFEFQPERSVPIKAVFGSDAELPVTMTSEFVHRDDPSRSLNVSWMLIDASNNVVLRWDGLTNQVAVIEADLPPGQYTLNTTAGENVDAIQKLDIAPFAPIATIGHVLLSLLLIALAFGESAVRKFIAKKIEQSEASDDKPKEFRKTRLGMPEIDGHEEMEDSPWREPIVL